MRKLSRILLFIEGILIIVLGYLLTNQLADMYKETGHSIFSIFPILMYIAGFLLLLANCEKRRILYYIAYSVPISIFIFGYLATGTSKYGPGLVYVIGAIIMGSLIMNYKKGK